MLRARKRVQALPVGRLASRYPPDHSSSDHFSSEDSSSDSPLDSLSGYSSDTSSKIITVSMAASAIAISADSSEESVGTSTARVILFSTILTAIATTDPYEVTVARWRSRVATRSSPSSSPTDMTLPIRQILPAPPSLPRRPAVLVLPGQPIPIG
nr:hypothetical protein [Tanacetum cinerariifolium]